MIYQALLIHFERTERRTRRRKKSHNPAKKIKKKRKTKRSTTKRLHLIKIRQYMPSNRLRKTRTKHLMILNLRTRKKLSSQSQTKRCQTITKPTKRNKN